MKIEILGTGCPKCIALERVVQQAVAKAGGFHEVVKVDDIMQIMQYNVVSTPGLVIDGKVVSTDKVLSIDEVVKLMEKNSR